MWSLPQGGIEEGELPFQAAYREMGEELGVSEPWPPLVGVYPQWLSYVIPPAYGKAGKVGMGQTILWHLFDWHVKGDPLKLNEEFAQCMWVQPTRLTYTDLPASPFKVQMYRELIKWLQDLSL
jgi:putative (di)nucleoside polyphosphate hydrolase